MDTDRPNQENAVMTVDCPWCAAEATIEPAATAPVAATFTCVACSVSVSMAPDIRTTPIARAA